MNVAELPTVGLVGDTETLVTANVSGLIAMLAEPVAVWVGEAESVPVAVTVKVPLVLYVVVKLAPLPVVGLPPGALQVKVQGGVPPEHAALNVTAVPTVPVAGPVTVTVRTPPTVWVAVIVFALESVVVRVTVKGPDVA